ncbi:hypothetical protein evm_008626 [Chilo suppressalis]|nr:hypothetical protein evm_008626 [Chilo suppressalis]
MSVVHLYAALAAAATFCTYAHVGGSGQPRLACKLLQETHSKTEEGGIRDEVSLSVYGRERQLQVIYDKRAPSRAAAALLAVVLRYGLRYRNVTLFERPDTLCQMAKDMQTKCSQFDESDSIFNKLVLIPAMSWTGDRCEEMEICNVDVVPLRLQVASGGAASLRLYLHVVLSADARTLPECRHASHWYTNHSYLTTCGFINRSVLDGIDHDSLVNHTELWYAIDAPGGNNTVSELKKRLENVVAEAKTLFSIKFVPLNSETYLHQRILGAARTQNSSVFFLDYNIWENVQGVQLVQPPPCTGQDCDQDLDSIRSLRVADMIVLKQLAPRLLKVFEQFSPTPTQLREVLLETEQSNSLPNAACKWAANNTSSFKAWYQIEFRQHYWIAVFLCKNDQELDHYKKIARAVERLYHTSSEFNVSVYFIEIDCTSESDLTHKFIKATVSSRWPNMIGAIAAGAGAKMVAEYALQMETALILYDMPSESVRLGSAVYAAGGTLDDLAIAVRYFITSHKWRRLAILSEETHLASDFVIALQRDENLIIRNVPLHKDIKPIEILQSLKKSNARILLINTITDISKEILCLAQQLEMTYSNGYVWILRELRMHNLSCDNSLTLEHAKYITISYWWQRQSDTHLFLGKDTLGKENVFHQVLNNFNGSFPHLTVPMIDALQVLIESFHTFTRSFSWRIYDIHGNGSVRLLLKTLEEKYFKGVLQNLHYVKGALNNPLVFVTEWIGNHPVSTAKWIVENKDIKIFQNQDFYKDKIPTDGTSICLTTSVGEPFEPTCQDKLWFPISGCLLIIVLFLWLSWRIRVRNLAYHDSILTAQLLAQREVISSQLVNHFVDRGALELYYDLGRGQFGRVRYGVLRVPGRSPISVAVKELLDDYAPVEESELIQEAITLASLQHPHVVRLIGVCTTDGPLLVLMEYAFFGNLRDYFCERRHFAESATGYTDSLNEAFYVSAESITRLAWEACSALDYLSTERLVHRDIRAINCLIDEQRSLKLADFGLARTIGTGTPGGDDEYLCRSRGLFPVRWMAPESLDMGVFTMVSDVWALGVLLLEMVTLGARPYGDWPSDRVISYVLAGGYPPLPNDISEETRQLLMRCWEPVPEERLTAAEIANELMQNSALLQPALGPTDPIHNEENPESKDYVNLNRNNINNLFR